MENVLFFTPAIEAGFKGLWAVVDYIQQSVGKWKKRQKRDYLKDIAKRVYFGNERLNSVKNKLKTIKPQNLCIYIIYYKNSYGGNWVIWPLLMRIEYEIKENNEDKLYLHYFDIVDLPDAVPYVCFFRQEEKITDLIVKSFLTVDNSKTIESTHGITCEIDHFSIGSNTVKASVKDNKFDVHFVEKFIFRDDSRIEVAEKFVPKDTMIKFKRAVNGP